MAVIRNPKILDHSPLSDARWDLVQRILVDEHFLRSARLRSLLSHITEHSLKNPGQSLSEQQIGRAVFERSEGYSPSEDNIVRVHARQLRLRLEEYFAGNGKDEKIVIEIPKGAYLPVFHAREAVEDTRDHPVHGRARDPLTWLMAGAIAVLGLIVGWMIWKPQSPRMALAEPSWILASVMETGQPTRLVLPDSSFGMLQGFLGRSLSLEDYLSPAYPKGLGPALENSKPYLSRMNEITSRPYTTFSEVLISSRLSVEADQRGWKVTTAYARSLLLRDFDSGNFILLGSPKSNPWTSLFEKSMNFQSVFYQDGRRGGILNREPRVGEARELLPAIQNGYPGEVYALVGLQHKLHSNVMTLAGTNMEATEAAWGFVASAERSKELLGKLGLSSPPNGEFRLEVVLRSHAMAGSARDTSVLATRFQEIKP